MWILREPPGRFFEPAERAMVEALFDAVLPGGDRAPGASDANAAEYVDRLLAMDASTYYEIPRWQELYRSALPLVAAAAQSLHGAALPELSADERRDVVARLQKGELEGMDGVDQHGFFVVLRNHCIEGCFSDPRWGGNANRVMWRWYGYLQPARPFTRDAAADVRRAAEAPTEGSSLARHGG